MDGGNELIAGMLELAKISPSALVALLASAPALGSLWIVARIIKAKEAAPKEPEADDDSKILREMQAIHATIKAGFDAVGKAQADALLEVVRQGAKK